DHRHGHQACGQLLVVARPVHAAPRLPPTATVRSPAPTTRHYPRGIAGGDKAGARGATQRRTRYPRGPGAQPGRAAAGGAGTRLVRLSSAVPVHSLSPPGGRVRQPARFARAVTARSVGGSTLGRF